MLIFCCFSLSWAKESSLPNEIDLLLLMEGTLAVEFAKSCLISSDPIDEVSLSKVAFYKIPNTQIIICTSLNDDDTKFGEITLLLQPLLEKSSNVICIQSLSSTRYQNLSVPISNSIIRTLQTTHSTGKLESRLEQPNILSGLTAGGMSTLFSV